MRRKPAELPHIEDAAFAACLAPLAHALVSNAEAGIRPHDLAWAATDPQRVLPSSADLASPGPTHRLRNPGAAGDECVLPGATGPSRTANTLAEWRSLADQEFAEFRTIELFLAKTEAELAAAVRTHPRQILGFLARISRIENRRALQHQTMAALMARIHTAIIQAAAEAEIDLLHPAMACGDLA